jgi:hypothetical protein
MIDRFDTLSDEREIPIEVKKKLLEKKDFLFVPDVFLGTTIDIIRDQLKSLLMAKDYVLLYDEAFHIHLGFKRQMKRRRKKELLESIHRAIVADDIQENASSMQEVATELVSRKRDAVKRKRRSQPFGKTKLSIEFDQS